MTIFYTYILSFQRLKLNLFVLHSLGLNVCNAFFLSKSSVKNAGTVERHTKENFARKRLAYTSYFLLPFPLRFSPFDRCEQEE